MITNTENQLKFRAWNATDKKMITPDMPFIGAGSSALNVCITLDGKTRLPNAYSLDYGYEAPVPELHFMQYVGMNDSENKEICSGDILESIKDVSLFRWVVCFHQGCFGIRNISLVDFEEATFYPINTGDFFSDRRIVGNVFQNLELLKVD